MSDRIHIQAARVNNIDMVERCLDLEGTDIYVNVRNAKDIDNRHRCLLGLNIFPLTPLQDAYIYGYDAIVKKLLDAGADVNFQDNRGKTVAMLTPIQDHTACLLRLTQVQCFDPGCLVYWGQTPAPV